MDRCVSPQPHSPALKLSLSLSENVFAVKSWCKQRFSCEESELDKQFNIPEDFDYIS